MEACTGYHMHLMRTCADLTFYFCLRYRCGVHHVYNYLLIFYFIRWYSSTPRVIGIGPVTTDCIVL